MADSFSTGYMGNVVCMCEQSSETNWSSKTTPAAEQTTLFLSALSFNKSSFDFVHSCKDECSGLHHSIIYCSVKQVVECSAELWDCRKEHVTKSRQRVLTTSLFFHCQHLLSWSSVQPLSLEQRMSKLLDTTSMSFCSITSVLELATNLLQSPESRSAIVGRNM